MIIKPKNWDKFQHYRNRTPPWIKLHRDVLNDRAFMLLPTSSKALAPLLWLLASESEKNEINADLDDLEFRLRMKKSEIKDGLEALIRQGFFEVASNVLAECYQDASAEREGEGETELLSAAKAEDEFFEKFWSSYPRKDSKKKARQAWNKLTKNDKQKAIDDIKQRFVGVQRQFIPMAPTYLNGERWNDELPKTQQVQITDWI
jgi:predicted Fe-S protein YdhL (DUF1289 family)